MSDVDDDLDAALADAAAGDTHRFDAQPCPRCGLVHASEPMPPEIEAGLSALFDATPEPTMQAATLTIAGIDLRGIWTKLGAEARRPRLELALVRAVAEVLDESSSGEVYRRFRIYEAEHLVTQLHLVRQALNDFIEGHREGAASERLPQVVLKVCSALMTRFDEELATAVERYETACVEGEARPNPTVVADGHVEPEVSRFAPALREALQVRLHTSFDRTLGRRDRDD